MILDFEKGQTLDDVIAALQKFKETLSLNARLVTKVKIYVTMKHDKTPVFLVTEGSTAFRIDEIIYRDNQLQIKNPSLIKQPDRPWYLKDSVEAKYLPLALPHQTLNSKEKSKLERKMARIAAEEAHQQQIEREWERQKLERLKRQAYYQKKKAEKLKSKQ